MNKKSKFSLFFSFLFSLLVFSGRFFFEIWINLFTVLLVLSVFSLCLTLYFERAAIRSLLSFRRSKQNWSSFSLLMFSLVLYVCLNLLSFKYDKIFDLTINGQYSLSPQMLNLLSKNADEIKFKVFYKERKPTRVLKEVEEFFNLVKINFPQVTVSFLNIFDKPDEFQKLMTNQSVNANQEIFCFVSQKQNDEFIEDPCGESEVISGLHKVMKSPEKKIGLITGHGEVDLLIQDGTLLRKLLEGENAKFVPINLFKENDLNQYKLLFLIGPKAPLDRIELQRLEDYSQKGGSLWMALDPGFDLSLDSFLKTYDVEFLNNYVLDETSQFGQSVLLTDRYDNFLKDRLKATPALLILASELKNLDSTHVFPLLYGPENSHSYFDLTQARREVSRLPLAVLSNKFKGSLFLIGDSDFLTDEYIESYGNKQLISQVLRRLLGEDDFSMIEDKFPEMAVLKMTREMKFFILILSFLFPFLFLLLAFIIWYINSNRRRDNENHRNSIPNEN